jgi:hypothetical protein
MPSYNHSKPRSQLHWVVLQATAKKDKAYSSDAADLVRICHFHGVEAKFKLGYSAI